MKSPGNPAHDAGSHLPPVVATPSYEDATRFGKSVLLLDGLISFLLMVLEEIIPATNANHSTHLIYLD